MFPLWDLHQCQLSDVNRATKHTTATKCQIDKCAYAIVNIFNIQIHKNLYKTLQYFTKESPKEKSEQKWTSPDSQAHVLFIIVVPTHTHKKSKLTPGDLTDMDAKG